MPHGNILRFALAAVAMLSASAHAQGGEGPQKLELSVGYAFLWAPSDEPTTLPLGLAAGVGFNASSSLGIVADAGIGYNEGADAVNEAAFLGGLRYTFRRSRLSPFVEALGGGARRSVTTSGTTVTAWDSAVQVGAGVLMRIGPGSHLRASADVRNVFGEGASAQRFRLVLGATLGLGHAGRGGSTGEAPSRAAPDAAVPAPAPATPLPPATAPSQGPTSEPSLPSNIVQFPTQQPVGPTRTVALPPPMTQAPVASSGRSLPEGFARGTQLLRSGRYAEASTAFQSSLGPHAASGFTVAVGLFCEDTHIAQLVKAAGDSEPLFVVASVRGGRTCYAAYWGVFLSQSEAQHALGSVPEALRARGQGPIAISRLLR
jgi:hypothetical protein